MSCTRWSGVLAFALRSSALAGLLFSTVPVLAAGSLIISEFRLRGPGGANDEFIEIYNDSNSPHTVTPSGGSGYAVAASDGAVRCTIPGALVIPARGHFLCTNSIGYSLPSYPSGPTGAIGDATYTTNIPDNAGIALFNNNVGGASFSAMNRLDAVGSTSEANVLYKEGTGVPALSPFSIDYSFVRDACGKGGSITTLLPCTIHTPKDTDNNAADFYFIDTNGVSAGAGQRLGAPGPQKLTSHSSSTGSILIALADSTVAFSSSPNVVRDLTPVPAQASSFGTVSLRRRVTNNTGVPLTHLRFRVDDITTFPAPSVFADLRPRNSTPTLLNGINDPGTCAIVALPPPCSVPTVAANRDEPPSQPNGGGFNTSLGVVSVTPGTPLAAGASIVVEFLLGVQQTGVYKIGLRPEGLPLGGGPTDLFYTQCETDAPCGISAPTIAKAFSPTQVPVNGTSTMTFTIANPNPSALSGIGFADTFPAGLEVAAPVTSTNTCGGSFTVPLAGGQTSLGYTGGSLTSLASCTVSVAVRPTTAGVKSNTTGPISSTQSGAGDPSNTASLTAVAPPAFVKGFLLPATVVGQTTFLSFAITNLNTTVSLTGVSFTDVLPAGLAITDGSMSLCGGTLTRTAATRTIALTGLTLTPGPFTCSFTSIPVTGIQAGTFVNLTGTITANESGPGGTATSTLVVNPAGTTTVINSDAPDPSVTGQGVVVSYSVSPVAPGAGTPTGNVSVTDGVNNCVGTVAAGSCTIPLLTPGVRTLTASYPGDGNFNGSVSTSVGHQVDPASTTTTITSDAPDPSAVGQPYAVIAGVAVTAPGAGVPTGTITVSDGASTCNITVPPGTTCNLTSVTPGNKTLTATYNGSAAYSTSVSAGVPHSVCAIPSAVVTPVPNPVCAGSAGNKASVPDPGVLATFTWGITNGTITAGAGTREITYTAGAIGNVGLTVSVSVAPPCTANGSATIAITPLPDPTISTPASVCAPATGVLASVPDAGPGATYIWTIVNGTITAGAGTRTITYSTLPSSVTSLAITVNRLGCVRSATAVVGNTGLSAPMILPVDFNRAPEPTAVQALSFCVGAPLGLRATEGYTSYVWYRNAMPIAGATSSVYSVASATLANAGSYTVTGTRDGCTSPLSAATAVSVTACPAPAIASVSPICANVIGGRVVTVTGTGFQPGATLTLAGTPAAVTSVTPTSIVATAAARAAAPVVTGNVVVTNPDTQTATLAGGFSYAVRGDANNNGAITAADTHYLKFAIYLGGPAPATLCNGDANGNGATTGADYFFLNLYVFLGGPPPGP